MLCAFCAALLLNLRVHFLTEVTFSVASAFSAIAVAKPPFSVVS
jgi:hypothetical protein